MLLEQVQTHIQGETYRFVRVRTDGSPLDILTITTNTKDTILRMEIRENERGDCAFTREGELEFCNGWESESQAQEVSSWSRHFPQPATIGPQDAQYALGIFEDLAAKISDTYLRHLLYQFPGRKSLLVFDARLYRIHNPPVSTPVIVEPEEITIAADIKSHYERIRENMAAFINHHRLAAISAAAILLAGICFFVFHLITRDGFGDDPKKWAQLTKDQIKGDSINPKFEQIAYRYRNFPEVMNSEALPFLKLSKRTFPALLEDYKRIKGGIAVGGLTSQAVILPNYDSLLDDIYFESPNEQLRRYHSSVYLNPRLSSFAKARLLHRLYHDNLVRTLASYSANAIFIAYDYIEKQTNKAELGDYLLRLMALAPDSEVAAEAHLIFAELTEIQQRLVQLLYFDVGIVAQCRDSGSAKNSVENAVCTIVRRYAPWVSSTESESRKRFQEFILQVLEHGLTHNRISYRRNDMLFAKSAALLPILQNYQEFTEFRTAISGIRPYENYGEFTHAAAYRRIVSSPEWRTLEQTRILKIPGLEMHVNELEAKWKYYSNERDRALAEIKDLSKMRKYRYGKEHEMQIQRRSKRESRLNRKKH